MRSVRERPRVAAATALLVACLVALSAVAALAVRGDGADVKAQRDKARQRAAEGARTLRVVRGGLGQSRSAGRDARRRVEQLEQRQRNAATRERQLRRSLRAARRRLAKAGLPTR